MGGARSQRSSRRSSQSFNYEDLFGNARGQQTKRQSGCAGGCGGHTEQENLDITQELNVTAKDLMADKPINVKMNNLEKCTKCSGGGTVCSECGGTGIVSRTRNLTVKFPKGIKEGQKIRLKGEGKIDNYGRKGDLYFSIKLKDSEYTLEDETLSKTVEITPAEAVLGCKKDVQTLHGIINIKIPPETRNGKTLRLKELGLPKKSGGFGNLNIKIAINLPKQISEKQKELYKKIMEIE